jgi:hypothetical protein
MAAENRGRYHERPIATLGLESVDSDLISEAGSGWTNAMQVPTSDRSTCCLLIAGLEPDNSRALFRRVGGANCEYGNRRFPDDPFSYTSKYKVFKTSPPMGRHNHQVSINRRLSVYYSLTWLADLDYDCTIHLRRFACERAQSACRTFRHRRHLRQLPDRPAD